jgi:hypothetical protein
MRAIMTCVSFSDILSVSLPYNRHHWDEIMVVTSSADRATQEIATQHGARLHVTDCFWDNGAEFAKWKALEQGLDAFGRHGWMAMVDVDVLWPKYVPWLNASEDCWGRRVGNLYAPLRRMAPWPIDAIPPESRWTEYPLHRQQREMAGYSQLFHADDPVLGQPPWFDTRWRHCGGGDSEFQAKWPEDRKIRPPFQVLHLGESGAHWLGRGATPEETRRKRRALSEMLRKRTYGPGRFDHEKLK